MSEPEEKILLQPKFKKESIAVIHSFIKQKVEETGANGILIGLSGGLDSAVVTKLCTDAIGPEKVLALIMPETTTPEKDVQDALSLATSLGVTHRIIDITDTVAAFTHILTQMELDRTTLGNIKARCRMILLYTHSNIENRIVMGTSNKSELLCGYFTKFGDGGADFSPIGDLYKSQIKDLARAIQIPEDLVEKPPSAGLAEGQTDEKELGISYENLDRILLGIELRMEPKDISQNTGIEISEVDRIVKLVEKNVHKRKMPLIPKIGIRTFGLDWRE